MPIDGNWRSVQRLVLGFRDQDASLESVACIYGGRRWHQRAALCLSICSHECEPLSTTCTALISGPAPLPLPPPTPAQESSISPSKEAGAPDDPVFDTENNSATHIDPVRGPLVTTNGAAPVRGSEPEDSVSSNQGSIVEYDASGTDDETGGGVLLKGDLLTRPDNGEGPWQAEHYVLERGRLSVYEDRHHSQPLQTYRISPGCSVFETNLCLHSFEVVVSSRVLHLQVG